MKYARTTLAFVMAALMLMQLLALSSCSGDTPADATTKPPESVSDTTAEETTTAPRGYNYGDYYFDGYEFTVLNFDERWSNHMDLTVEEVSGDPLDEAIYNRNLKVEEKLGYTMKEAFPTASGNGVLNKMISSAVVAGDESFDAAYLPINDGPGIMTDGSLMDLASIDTIHFEENYWDKSINDGLMIGDRLYTASSPLFLMTFDLTWVLMFNEDMFTDLKLEKPYQLVRDGKWTIDKFNEYVTAGTQAMGDVSFTDYSDDANCIYGIAAHGGATLAMAIACGTQVMTIEKDGSVATPFADERMINVMNKLADVYRTSTGKIRIQNSSSVAGFYINVFRNGRSAFLTAELNTALGLRDMEQTFGVIPFPKYDEAQERYYANITKRASFLTVPTTQKNPERVGVILDALSYESAEEILPIYYDVVLSYKGMRNEDSVEMLNLIRESRVADVSVVLGPGEIFYDDTSAMIKAENVRYSSWVAEHKDAMKKEMEALIAILK